MTRPPASDDPFERAEQAVQRWLAHPAWHRLAHWLDDDHLTRLIVACLAANVLALLAAGGGMTVFLGLLLAGVAAGVWRERRLAHYANVVGSVIGLLAMPFLLVIGKIYAERGSAGGGGSGLLALLLMAALGTSALASLCWLWQRRFDAD